MYIFPVKIYHSATFLKYHTCIHIESTIAVPQLCNVFVNQLKKTFNVNQTFNVQ